MTDRARIVVYYAIWAAMCATVAGIVVGVIHTAFFAARPPDFSFVRSLVEDAAAGLMIAVGQGVVALLTGGIAARLGRTLQATVLLGLLIGLFDLVMYLVQMTVPGTELGWGPDIGILVGVTAAITLFGARRPATTA